jgi:hypothetical protein
MDSSCQSGIWCNLYGSSKITDLVGNVWTTTSEFTVTDPETPMQILTVAGHTPQNGIIPVRLHDDVTIETAVNDVISCVWNM